jgi:hypothetical protein
MCQGSRKTVLCTFLEAMSATGQTKVIFLERLILLSVNKIGCHNFSISRWFDLKKQQQSSLQAHQRAQLLFRCQTILE